MNEFDKKLLETDGFTVWLQDKPKDKYEDFIGRVQFTPDIKQWVIKW